MQHFWGQMHCNPPSAMHPHKYWGDHALPGPISFHHGLIHAEYLEAGVSDRRSARGPADVMVE